MVLHDRIFILDIKSKEFASTKKQAAQKVALSLVRQLFHLGAIEGAEPGQLQAKKLKTDEVWLHRDIYKIVNFSLVVAALRKSELWNSSHYF